MTGDAAVRPDCPRCRASLPPSARYCELCGAACDAPGNAGDRREQRVGSAAGVTDRGLRRRRNEDAFAIRVIDGGAGGATVCVVCDGVSSTPRADEAAAGAAEAGSAAAIESLRGGRDIVRAVEDGLVAAAASVSALVGPADPADPALPGAPASTYVSVIELDGQVAVGWVGDSRAYWVPADTPDRSIRLTEDDSWLATALAAGVLSRTDALAHPRAHAITGWLGADNPRPRLHVTASCLIGSGFVVVCTDGLSGYLDEPAALAAALPHGGTGDPLLAARSLVRTALRAGGRDNITVAVVPIDLPTGTEVEART